MVAPQKEEPTHEEEMHRAILSKMHPPEMVDHYMRVRKILQKLKADQVGIDHVTIDAGTYHGWQHAEHKLPWKTLKDEANLHPGVLNLLGLYSKVPIVSFSRPITPAIISELYHSSSNDPRVFIIAAANSLDMLSDPKIDIGVKRIIAKKVTKIYAPDAHRAGYSSLANLLQDAAFKVLHPVHSNFIQGEVNRRFKKTFTHAKPNTIRGILEKDGVIATVIERAKGQWSTTEKIFPNIPNLIDKIEKLDFKKARRKIRDLSDLHAMMVITEDGTDENGIAYYDAALASLKKFYEEKYPGQVEIKRNITQATKTGYFAHYLQLGKKKGKGGLQLPVEIQIMNKSIYARNLAHSPHWLYKGEAPSVVFGIIDKFNLDLAAGKVTVDDKDSYIHENLRNVKTAIRVTIGNKVKTFPAGVTPIDIISEMAPSQLRNLASVSIDRLNVPLGKRFKVSGDFELRLRIAKTPQVNASWLKHTDNPRTLMAIKKELGLIK